MNRFTVKDWVCLVDEATLEAKRRARQKYANYYLGSFNYPLSERLWRQIEITATAEKVTLRLMNVDQEAALGGVWSGGEDCHTSTFTWEDLHDTEFIDSLLAREQVIVYRCAMAMLTTLKARIVTLREALNAF